MTYITIQSNGKSLKINLNLLTTGTLLHTLGGGHFTFNNIPYNALLAYKSFLEFNADFEWNEGIERWFGKFGHTNTLKYPNSFWKVKLVDDRLREFWYSGLVSNEIKRNILIELPCNSERVNEVMGFLDGKLPAGHYIAGGAALYIAGITDKYSDIDIFTCNKDASEAWIKDYVMDRDNVNYVVTTGNSVSYKNSVRELGWKSIQLILREYTCPSEIIHGFDIGSCSILYDPNVGNVLTTYKGKYCINEKVNWFEPDRSSPTYAYRLAKYHIRGFDIMLPSSEGLMTDITDLQSSISSCRTFADISYEVDIDEDRRKKLCIPDDIYASRFDNDRPIMHNKLAMAINALKFGVGKHKSLLYYSNMNEQFDSCKSDEIVDRHTNALDSIPKDPMSVIILASCYCISPSLIKAKATSDYETRETQYLTNVKDLEWKVLNPMEQGLTGTFYPKPIQEDVRSFYLSSPLVTIASIRCKTYIK